MQINFLKKSLFLALSFITIVFFSLRYHYPKQKISKQDSAWLFEPRYLQVFSLGFDRALSTMLWTETLMNADIEKYKNRDLKDWFYMRLKSILYLDPKFYAAYVQGALYLSIIKDDEFGAKDIYEQGLIHFPDDYELNLSGGFHDYFEMNNPSGAIQKWNHILNHPKTTSHIKRLLAKMISSENGLQEAFLLIKSQWEKAKEGSPEKKSYEENLYSIKAEIDLECLNNNQKNCSKLDLYQNPYLYKGGKWSAQRDWKKFRVHKKRAP